MDRFTSVILFAGLGCFGFSFLMSGVYPYLITDGLVPETSIVELAKDVSVEFKELKASYPVAFGQSYPTADGALTLEELIGLDADDPRRAASESAWQDAYAVALRDGRDAYIAEVCFHCHSQFVRPVANESLRFGPVLPPANDNNALQRPMLWGTRRVGPDLTHEGRLRSNDWHVAHFFNPPDTSPGSVMPKFPWFFRDGWQVRRSIDPGKADRGGIDEGRSYPMPGVFETKAEAEAELARLKEELPSALSAEKDRLFVEAAKGPNGTALSIIAYLQWMGTWVPPQKVVTP